MRRPRVLAVVPARWGSTRFPGKPLATIAGEPMIVHVIRRAARIGGVDRALVATDDRRILAAVEAAGFEARMTGRHRSGTGRVAEAAAGIPCGIVLNIQGDEPLLPVAGVERLVETMLGDRGILMGTLASPCADDAEKANPDVVKAVVDARGDALYFSRAPVPSGKGAFLRHVGVYAFRRSFLFRYGGLPRGPLERREGLEQLRALENGVSIRVVRCRARAAGVDRPGDIKRVEKLLAGR
ncbi:MAG: 3-deoxy-manno-octulosonate cytidylyltransferase [Candidatus Krumholzibacteriota bacterium]|nr:3-deoxy-manno-octulosonate cytidylyltransferase [Candidatus Krumholzibacteriota bacterium]